LGPELIQETTGTISKIQEHIRVALKPTENYANKRRRSLEFQVGDKVFLKVSPTKSTKRFGMRGKLSPTDIGPQLLKG